MRSADRLHKEFESYRHQGAVTRTATITDAGLIVGAGTLLVRMRKDQFGQLRFALREDRDRAIALHCIAFRQAPKPDFLHHVACAANHWPHDKALANLRLVFARLPKLKSEADAWRLHLAAALLDDEFPPGRLLNEIGFDRIDFHKYDPDQPRVPAGQGRQSGEWGSTGGSFKVPKAPSSGATASSDQVTPQDAKAKQSENSMARDVAAVGTRVEDSFLDSGIDVEALAGLTEFASKFTAATAFFGAIFIPSPNSGTRSTGTLPGTSSISYSVDHDTGALDLSTVDANGHTATIRAQLQDGTYVDVATGARVGRDLNGTLYLDRDAVASALDGPKDETNGRAGAATQSKNDEPKLCPDEVPDNPGATNRADAVKYSQYVSQTIVNPQRQPPLEPGMAFGLLNLLSGKIVKFDDCKDTNGFMQEFKGYHAWRLNDGGLTAKMAEEFTKQADSQIQANDLRNLETGIERPIDWHFKDEDVAAFAWDLFKRRGFLPKIHIYYTPEGEGISRRLPDP